MTAPLLSEVRVGLLERIHRVAVQEGLECYLVGGFVRDLLLRKSVDDKDVDILVVGSASVLARSFAKEVGGEVKTFAAFHTAKVCGFSGFAPCSEVDFASARTEVYEHPGSLPVVRPADLKSDLQRRDFTVNAIALPVSALLPLNKESLGSTEDNLASDGGYGGLIRQIVDPFGGYRDLETGTLRVLHERSFFDDPTRIFRLYRYVARLSFCLDKVTERLLHEASAGGVFQTITTERFWSEFRKMLAEPAPAQQLLDLHALGAFGSHGEIFSPFQTISREWLMVYAQSVQALPVDRRVELFLLLLVFSFWVTVLNGDVSQESLSEIQRVFSKLGIGRKKLKFFLSFFSDLLRGRYELGELFVEIVRRYSA